MIKSKLFKLSIIIILNLVLTIKPFYLMANEIDIKKIIEEVNNYYFKNQKSFALDFKAESKLKDISFVGQFLFKYPFNFVILINSPNLKAKLVFKDDDGFIYLPNANIITKLDAKTRLKNKGIDIPKNVEQLNTLLLNLHLDYEIKSNILNDNIVVEGITKKGLGAFKVILAKNYEIKTINIFNKSGKNELSIELENFHFENINDDIFKKPISATEVNLPVQMF